jgi:hypothetical protein
MQVETAKRFDQLASRMDHFMIWSFATTLTGWWNCDCNY